MRGKTILENPVQHFTQWIQDWKGMQTGALSHQTTDLIKKYSANTLLQEMSICHGIGPEKYSKLTTRNSNLSTSDEHTLLQKLLSAWRQHLQAEKLQDCFTVNTETPFQHYNYTLVDEAQELPVAAINYLGHISNPLTLYIGQDPLQAQAISAKSSQLHKDVLQSAIGPSHEVKSALFSGTYRSTQETVRVANNIRKYISSFPSSERITYQNFKSANTQKGTACLLDNKDIASIKNLCQSTKTVVIIPDANDREEAQKNLETFNIITGKESSGMEFETVVLYHWLQHKTMRTITQSPGIELKPEQKEYLNGIYVATTRNTKNLIIFESQDRTQPLAQAVFGELSTANPFTSLSAVSGSTPGEWEALALKHAEAGNHQTASDILEKMLGWSSKKIDMTLKPPANPAATAATTATAAAAEVNTPSQAAAHKSSSKTSKAKNKKRNKKVETSVTASSIEKPSLPPSASQSKNNTTSMDNKSDLLKFITYSNQVIRLARTEEKATWDRLQEMRTNDELGNAISNTILFASKQFGLINCFSEILQKKHISIGDDNLSYLELAVLTNEGCLELAKLITTIYKRFGILTKEILEFLKVTFVFPDGWSILPFTEILSKAYLLADKSLFSDLYTIFKDKKTMDTKLKSTIFYARSSYNSKKDLQGISLMHLLADYQNLHTLPLHVATTNFNNLFSSPLEPYTTIRPPILNLVKNSQFLIWLNSDNDLLQRVFSCLKTPCNIFLIRSKEGSVFSLLASTAVGRLTLMKISKLFTDTLYETRDDFFRLMKQENTKALSDFFSSPFSSVLVEDLVYRFPCKPEVRHYFSKIQNTMSPARTIAPIYFCINYALDSNLPTLSINEQMLFSVDTSSLFKRPFPLSCPLEQMLEKTIPAVISGIIRLGKNLQNPNITCLIEHFEKAENDYSQKNLSSLIREWKTGILSPAFQYMLLSLYLDNLLSTMLPSHGGAKLVIITQKGCDEFFIELIGCFYLESTSKIEKRLLCSLKQKKLFTTDEFTRLQKGDIAHSPISRSLGTFEKQRYLAEIRLECSNHPNDQTLQFFLRCLDDLDRELNTIETTFCSTIPWESIFTSPLFTVKTPLPGSATPPPANSPLSFFTASDDKVKSTNQEPLSTPPKAP